MWGWLTALVRGLADSFWGWFSAYRQGRMAQQVKDLEGQRDVEHRVLEAVDAIRADPGDFELGPDGRVRRRVPPPPAGVPGGIKPNPPAPR